MIKTYRVYGRDGHRQRKSFGESFSFESERGKVEVRNSDITGTNDYTELVIESENPDAELEVQLVDGIFENSRYGRIEEV